MTATNWTKQVSWPTRPDGSNKTVGEMTDAERKAVMAAAKKRFFEQGEQA